ncbi:MAG: TlyA family RNA methyltransferase [Acidimicrobiales bacterium]
MRERRALKPDSEVATSTRRRLDAELVVRGLADSRQRAQDLIEAGRVTVGGAPAFKSSRQVSPAEPVLVSGRPDPFVGRGGHKLEGALDKFSIDVADRWALDAGSSTGGFTDCLLQRGAAGVAAVDVGTNQLHERLRADDRVDIREQTDIRAIALSQFDAPMDTNGFDVIVTDLSFISTTRLLPHFATLLAAEGDLVVLIKPQFEAGRSEVSRGRGVIRDPAVWERVLHAFVDQAAAIGLPVIDLAISPVVGGKGNVEFLAHLRRGDILGTVIEERP